MPDRLTSLDTLNYVDSEILGLLDYCALSTTERLRAHATLVASVVARTAVEALLDAQGREGGVSDA